MNLASGLEGASPALFWRVLAAGVVLGLVPRRRAEAHSLCDGSQDEIQALREEIQRRVRLIR